MIYFIVLILLLGFIFLSLRFAWWRKNIPYKYPRVLMYHMTREHLPKSDSKFNRLRVSPKEFEKQLKWLKNNGFESYFLSQMLPDMPKKSVCITFDDGYKDNLLNALPLLKKYNFKATIFIVINRFKKNWATDKDLDASSSELNAEEMLNDDDVKKLLESGLIEIGSHTLNHANLNKLTTDEKEYEIIKSKEAIEKTFGITCKSFAYPFGFYDKGDVAIAKKANYECATTTHPDVYKEIYGRHEIPRIVISGRQNIFHFILKMKKGRCR